MKRSGPAFVFLPAVALLVILLAVQCGDNASDTILDPSAGVTVAEGVISGALDWGEGIVSRPATVVYAIRGYDPGCAGGVTTVHVTGTYNNWSEDAWVTAPGMNEIFPCYWIEEISLKSGDLDWKFVTSGSWDGSYAGCGACEIDETTRRGTATDENGDDLTISIPTDDDYWFLLNAASDPAIFHIAKAEEVPWDTTGGDSDLFSIGNLEEGRYTLVIRVPGEEDDFPTRYIRGITVSGDQGTEMDTVDVIASGAIIGSVLFSDSPDPRPSFDVRVAYSETGAVVDTFSFAPTDTVFALDGLSDGTYDVTFDAAGYVDTTIEDVIFDAGADRDLGAVVLTLGGMVTGIVDFQDDPETKPEVTITAVGSADSVMIATTTADAQDGSFELDGLPAGATFLTFRALRYVTDTLEVTIIAGQTNDVGTVVLVSGCVSVATTIHIMGDFNGWNEDLWITDPGMDQVSSCIWRDTIDIPLSSTPAPEFKFVTDETWSTANYNYCPDSTGQYDSLTGPVCLTEGGGNILLTGASIPGRYEIVLDEAALTYQAYLLTEFAGRISGTIEFDTGLEPPLPAVTVEARLTGETTLLASASMNTDDGTFVIDGLDAGTYDVLVKGQNNTDTTLVAVLATADTQVDLGTIVVEEVLCQSEFTVIRVVGDFNGWNDPPAPSMIQVESCVWVDTLFVSGGCHYMKFRTGEDWGSNDYMNCGEQDGTCSTPLSGFVCQEIGGDPALGQLNFEASGNYEFRLDEADLTYTITKLD